MIKFNGIEFVINLSFIVVYQCGAGGELGGLRIVSWLSVTFMYAEGKTYT